MAAKPVEYLALAAPWFPVNPFLISPRIEALISASIFKNLIVDLSAFYIRIISEIFFRLVITVDPGKMFGSERGSLC
ncbi:MAG: hypothetical protein ACOZFS_09850 [Thermodesulfobacteriota bacterium]